MFKEFHQQLVGTVYYTPISDEEGDIKIITFGGLSEAETEGLLSTTINPTLLAPLMLPTANISKYMLVFDKAGVPSVILREVEVSLALYELTFKPVQPHNEEVGLVLTLDGLGGGRCVAYNLPTPSYSYDSPVKLYFTHSAQINRPIHTVSLTMGAIIRDDAILTGLPKGFPVTDYSVWAVTPGPITPMWWSPLHA